MGKSIYGDLWGINVRVADAYRWENNQWFGVRDIFKTI